MTKLKYLILLNLLHMGINISGQSVEIKTDSTINNNVEEKIMTTTITNYNEIYSAYKISMDNLYSNSSSSSRSIVFKEPEASYQLGVNWSVYGWEKNNNSAGKQKLIALPFRLIGLAKLSDESREQWRRKNLKNPLLDRSIDYWINKGGL